jgi:hypothetical protein
MRAVPSEAKHSPVSARLNEIDTSQSGHAMSIAESRLNCLCFDQWGNLETEKMS